MGRFSIYSSVPTSGSTPFIHISIGDYTKEKDHILISPELMTEREIDESIDSLLNDLQNVRAKAKSELLRLRNI